MGTYTAGPNLLDSNMNNKFLSVVVPVRNRAADVASLAQALSQLLERRVAEYELVFVDNCSSDETPQVLRSLLPDIPNLQLYLLLTPTDEKGLVAAALENGIGEYVCLFDPEVSSLDSLAQLIQESPTADILNCRATRTPRNSLLGAGLQGLFYGTYRKLYGQDIASDRYACRMVARPVVSFILQHPQPYVAWRQLNKVHLFKTVTLTSDAPPAWVPHPQPLSERVHQGLHLLTLSGAAPMRAASGACLLGAAGSLGYALYAFVVGLIKTDVAPGWTSLSVTCGAMFFMFSVVLWVLSEYVSTILQTQAGRPQYSIGTEATSAMVTRRNKLNIEELPR